MVSRMPFVAHIFIYSKTPYDLLQVISKLQNQAMKGRELAITADIANFLGKLPMLPMNGRQEQRSAHHTIFKDASDHSTVLTAR